MKFLLRKDLIITLLALSGLVGIGYALSSTPESRGSIGSEAYRNRFTPIKTSETEYWDKQINFLNNPFPSVYKIRFVEDRDDLIDWCNGVSELEFSNHNRRLYEQFVRWCVTPPKTIGEALGSYLVLEDDYSAKIQEYKSVYNGSRVITQMKGGVEEIVINDEISEDLLKSWCEGKLKDRFVEENYDLVSRVSFWCFKESKVKWPSVSSGRVLEFFRKKSEAMKGLY